MKPKYQSSNKYIVRALMILIFLMGYILFTFNTNNLSVVRADGVETNMPELGRIETEPKAAMQENSNLDTVDEDALEEQMTIQSVGLLTEQFSLDQVDYSILIENIFIGSGSARADLLLITNGELGKNEDRIRVFALHDGVQLTQIFGEPSEEYYQFIDQVSPELLDIETVSFWKGLHQEELQATEVLTRSTNMQGVNIASSVLSSLVKSYLLNFGKSHKVVPLCIR